MVEQRTQDRRFGLVARVEPDTFTEKKLKFLCEDGRLRIPMACAYNSYWETKNDKKEKRGKTLKYGKESKEVREGLDISRATEWNKWKEFVA